MRQSQASVIAATVLAVGSLMISNAAVPNRAVEIEHRSSEPDPGEGPVPLPEPLPQTFNAPAMGTFQLVGFTRGTYDGTRGTLNYALACQAEFPNSRMCSADEIRNTVAVPPAPGKGAAWVEAQSRACLQITNAPREGAEEPNNCQGWRSNASSELGMAIDLADKYGALGPLGCDQMLRIACCAITAP